MPDLLLYRLEFHTNHRLLVNFFLLTKNYYIYALSQPKKKQII